MTTDLMHPFPMNKIWFSQKNNLEFSINHFEAQEVVESIRFLSNQIGLND